MEINLKRYEKSIKQDLEDSMYVERRSRKRIDKSDQAYLNQLKLDQDIFSGLLPELYKEMEKQ